VEILVADAARDRRQVPREQPPQNVKREQRDEKRICDIRKRREPPLVRKNCCMSVARVALPEGIPDASNQHFLNTQSVAADWPCIGLVLASGDRAWEDAHV